MRDRLRRLRPYRTPIALLAALLVVAIGLVTARAAGALDPTALLSPAPGASSSPSPAASPGSPAPSPSASPGSAAGGSGGGAKNIVQLFNRTDGRLSSDGRVQVDPVPAPNVAPVNMALAYGNCNSCDTFAVALQINLVGPQATSFTPQNSATAVNYMCNGCITVAIAYQYNIQVADPTQVPDRAHQVAAAMDMELRAISTDPTATVATAEARISAVIAQFQDLAAWLTVSRKQSNAGTDAGATPAPAPASPAATSSPSASPSSSPAPGAPQPSPSSSASPSPSPTP